MTSYCRLCAESKDSIEIATSITDTENLIEQKLIECCQWNVGKANARLPKDICVSCLDKLDKCWLFSQSVQYSQQKLLEIFGEQLRFHFDHSTFHFNLQRIKQFSFIANDIAESESESDETTETPKIIKILFDCIDCSKSFPSRIALEKHECTTETVHNQCDLCFKTFKTIYALRVHCKKQNERKCEICLQAFCKRSALKAHQDQGCERILEEPPNEPTAEGSKPTFVDCLAEPTPMEQDIDASFVCEIIPKPDDINVSDIENDEDQNIDDSSHATTSADNGVTPLQANCRRKTETKVKKTRKARNGERIQRIYEYENADDPNKSDEEMYSCYLCRRRY